MKVVLFLVIALSLIASASAFSDATLDAIFANTIEECSVNAHFCKAVVTNPSDEFDDEKEECHKVMKACDLAKRMRDEFARIDERDVEGAREAFCGFIPEIYADDPGNEFLLLLQFLCTQD